MPADFAQSSSRLLKVELARTGVTLSRLAARLNALGLEETEASLKNKIYRGTFSVPFLMACLAALGSSVIDVAAVLPDDAPRGDALDR